MCIIRVESLLFIFVEKNENTHLVHVKTKWWWKGVGVGEDEPTKNYIKQATHGLWSSAGLQMPIHAQLYRPAIWTSKVGQGDLVFDVRSGFASGAVHARLQVYVYSGYDLCHPGCPKIDSCILTPVTLKSRSNSALLYIRTGCKFSDRRFQRYCT